MDERKQQTLVGFFVLLAFVMLLWMIFLNSDAAWKGLYTVYLKPRAAPGVKAGTPVRKNGVLIGRVKDVQTGDDHVTLALNIYDDEKIYENEVASIGAESILGDAVIEIIPTTPDVRGNALAADGLINSVAIRRNPMEIVDVALNLETQISDTLQSIKQTASTFESTAERIGVAGDNVSQFTQSIQDAIGGPNGDVQSLIGDFRNVTQKTQLALDNFNRIFENVNDVVGDPEFKNRFNDVLATLPEIFQEVKGAVTAVKDTVSSFRKISDSADSNLKNLEGFTQSLSENGPEILETINERLANIDGVFDKIKQAAESLGKLQNSEGTIGKLLNDPALYNNALETVQSAREAVENIREQTAKIEPLINDARLFTDSIARDPGVIGIRGAIRNRDANKTGYKGNLQGRERIFRR